MCWNFEAICSPFQNRRRSSSSHSETIPDPLWAAVGRGCRGNLIFIALARDKRVVSFEFLCRLIPWPFFANVSTTYSTMSIIFKLCSEFTHTGRRKVGELESLIRWFCLLNLLAFRVLKTTNLWIFALNFFFHSRKIYKRSIFRFFFFRSASANFSCFEIKQVWLISFIKLSSVYEYKCFDIQSIWITILFQRISQVNCTSITFYHKLRKFVVYLLMIIRKRSINYAFVSLLFFSLSHSFSLIGRRSQTHRKSAPRYFFRLFGKKNFSNPILLVQGR